MSIGMNDAELLAKRIYSVQTRVKEEPNDCSDGGEERLPRKIAVKLEENMLESSLELHCNTEEEVKPPIGVFVSPTDELWERPEEEEKDPLALSAEEVERARVKEEKRDEEFLSTGCGAEDQRGVQWPREDGAPGNSVCVVSMETGHTVCMSTTTEAKSFQCDRCVRSVPDTNIVASHITHSTDRRLVCTEIFTANNANIVVPILNGRPPSTEHSGVKDMRVHSRGKLDVSPDCEKFKKRQKPLKLKDIKCTLYTGDMRFVRNQKLYECEQCKKSFGLRASLVRHLQFHTGKKPYECGECKKRFTTKSNLVKHSRIHKGEKPNECEECKKCFSSKSYLVAHSLIHMGETPYECVECKKGFITRTDFDRHCRIHTGEAQSHECGECKKCFSSKSYLVAHSRIHTGDEPYECGECKKRFTKKSNFVKHIQFHTGEKPFECEDCKKRFRTKQGVATHSQTHTRVKPYGCGECKKRFITKSNFVIHSRIHTGETPYESEECKKCFRAKSHLVKHNRTHTGEKL